MAKKKKKSKKKKKGNQNCPSLGLVAAFQFAQFSLSLFFLLLSAAASVCLALFSPVLWVPDKFPGQGHLVSPGSPGVEDHGCWPGMLLILAVHAASNNNDGKFHSIQWSQWLLLLCVYICLLSPGKILPKLPFRVQLRGAGREKVPTRNLAGWKISYLFPSNILGNPFVFCQLPAKGICPHYCATLFSLLRSSLRADNLPIMTNLKLENGHVHFKNSLSHHVYWLSFGNTPRDIILEVNLK